EDSQERSDADGDVTVHGQSAVNWEDGSATLAEDTSFAITANEILSEGENELFKDEVEQGAAQQARVPADQAEGPANITNPYDDLDTSISSADQ
ncbi:MAG: hypothetical protein R6U42_10855, partial [Halomonas sp.]